MSNKQNFNKQEHFHLGHLGLILLVAGLIFLLSWFKGDFRKSFSLEEENKLTYAAALSAEKKLEQQASASQGVQDFNNNQIGLLDPDYKSGSVLGASTSSGESIESFIQQQATPIPLEILNSIPIKTNDKNDQKGILDYAQQFSEAEYGNDAPGILAGLNSDSLDDLKNVPSKIENLLSALLEVSVPSDLANYHRLKLLYYAELRNNARVTLGLEKEQTAESISQQIFSVSEALNSEIKRIYLKYQIQL